jgi:LmbE family N-acetylglucosaminyl deacetylase
MIAVVSPHLDDGVFGCGGLLAERPGSVVITALAGGPPQWDAVTPWDAACGFAPGDDVIAARRGEDREALAVLGAAPVWLDFCDAQYGGAPSSSELGDGLALALAALDSEAVFVPLGLFHSDHRLLSEAVVPLVRALVRAGSGRRFYAYEEPMYRRVAGLTAGALVRLVARGLTPSPAALEAAARAPELKRRAVSCYRSQLRGLSTPGRPGYDDIFAPERFWRLLA